jgi:triacylglycerol lipase
MGSTLDQILAVLNGAVGDMLARTGNGLQLEMGCFRNGLPVELERDALARAYPEATPRVVVLVHGLMCTESIWTLPDGSDYGLLLARDLGLTPIYVRYNSGLSIPENGARLSALLRTLHEHYPIALEEIVPLGYSMGGLVIRSACHAAWLSGEPWLGRVRRAVYVGTPHRGAPLERAGRFVTRILRLVDDPYTRLVADIADLRSDGVKDLGDADLRHEDRGRRPWGLRLALDDPDHPVPLLPGIQHYLVAGSVSQDPLVTRLFGDALVPVASATNGGCTDAASLALPPSHIRFRRGLGHLALAHHPLVYDDIRGFLEDAK